MPTKEALLTAVAGKGVERGLEPEQQGDLVVLRYPTEQTDRQDNLHKQSIRSLVGRIAPDWKIHINSVDNGFTVEVRPKPDTQAAKKEEVAESKPDELSRLDRIADELEEIVKAFRASA